MSERVWYILIDGQEEGPFSKSELKDDKRITPMTLVRKEGSHTWLPISEYHELKDLFEEKNEEDETQDKAAARGAQEQALAMRLETEPPFPFFIVLLIFALLYFFFLMQRP